MSPAKERAPLPAEPEDQTDLVAELQELVRASVAASPSPPRAISAATVVRLMYRGRALKLGAAVLVSAALFVWSFYVPGSAVLDWLLRVFFAAGGIFFLTGAAWQGHRVVQLVRDGVVATGEVLESRIVPDGRDRPVVEGRRVLHHPRLGDFPDEFRIAAAWAASVREGSWVDVLVPPDSRYPVMTLGVRGAPR
jgi:hypothetical protein